MSIKIHQPHDTFLRRCLTNLEVAKDMLKSCISAHLAERINWDTLEPTNKSFAKKELRQIHSDFVFRCQLKSKKTYMFLLLEHQSTPDRFLTFRILSYDISLMEQHLQQIKKQKDKYLPNVTNICLYSGKKLPIPIH